MTIAAIETTYRGYRFRSRLEARWAVFFDHMGLKWKYEHQGYPVGESGHPYLPDFWLPELFSWAEVKGDPAALDLGLVAEAVHAEKGLPTNDPFGDRNLLILGDIPDPAAPHGWLHWLVSCQAHGCEMLCNCTDVRYTTVAFRHVSEQVKALAVEMVPDLGDISADVPPAQLQHIGAPSSWRSPPALMRDLVSPRPCMFLYPDLVVAAAYRAARSARFEHGEAPSPPFGGAS